MSKKRPSEDMGMENMIKINVISVENKSLISVIIFFHVYGFIAK